MEQSLLSGVLALSLALLNPTSQTFVQTDQVVSQEEMRDYAVKEGDTLSMIAEQEYGSKDFWTNIWNDNSWIEKPDLIEKDWKLKLRNTKPLAVATLSAELEKKIHIAQPAVANIATQTANVQAFPIVNTPTYAGGPLNEAQITFLGTCESGMTASRNSGNGYFGAFQFSIPTWNSMGTGYERADMAPLDVQKDAVQRLLGRSSIYTQFPGCARKMQSLGII